MSFDTTSYRAQTFRSVIFVMVGYFAYSIADLCSKLLQQHYSIYQVLGVSGFIGMTITGTWVLVKYGPRAFFPDNLKLHLLRALLVLGTAFFAVSGLRTLPLADFYGIVFMTPFWVKILAVLMLKETVGWRRWLATAVGFLGIIILVGPQFNEFSEGVIYTSLGVFCAGFNVITLRKIGGSAPLPLYGFYPLFLIALFNLTMLFITGKFLPFESQYLPTFALHGPFVVVGILAISMGFAKAPETVVIAPLQYLQIIWGVLFGYIFFNNIPTETTAIGLALIIGAGLYSLWREYRRKHPELQP